MHHTTMSPIIACGSWSKDMKERNVLFRLRASRCIEDALYHLGASVASDERAVVVPVYPRLSCELEVNR